MQRTYGQVGLSGRLMLKGEVHPKLKIQSLFILPSADGKSDVVVHRTFLGEIKKIKWICTAFPV